VQQGRATRRGVPCQARIRLSGTIGCNRTWLSGLMRQITLSPRSAPMTLRLWRCN
jgi:hypothetical protein